MKKKKAKTNIRKKLILLVFLVGLGVFSVLGIFIIREANLFNDSIEPEVKNFEQCMAMGYPIIFGEQLECRGPGGIVFTEKQDKIDSPDEEPDLDRDAQDDKTKIASFEDCLKAGYPIMESYPRQCRTPDGDLFIEVIKEQDEGKEDKKEDEKDENKTEKTKQCIITGCSSHVCAEESVITTCEFLPYYECYKSAVCAVQSNGECGWTMDEDLKQCLALHGATN